MKEVGVMVAIRQSTAVLLIACLLGAGVFNCCVLAGEQKGESKQVKAADDLPALLKARLEAGQKEYEARKQEFLAGRGTLDYLNESGRRVLTAQVELSDKKANQVAAYETYLRGM